VLVPQGSLLPSDKLSVIWQGAAGTPVAGSYTSPQRLVSAGLEIAVPRSVLAYSLGKQVTVTYEVERDGKLTPSLPLPLNILTLPATALIPPKIIEADANNFLDLMALGSNNATIHALLHTLIEADQPCWLSLEGKKADGTAHNLTLWNGLPARVNATWISQGFWATALANSYLKQLGHGTTLTIKFKVSMDKSNNPVTATVFPDRTYIIKALELVLPTLDNVLDAGNKEVLEGGLTVSTTLKLKGTASNGQTVEIFDGSGLSAVSKGTATANATTGVWEHTITVPVGGRRLYAQSRYHPTPVNSNVRNLTVVAAVTPTIDSVKDTKNIEIPQNGTTTDTTVTLAGKATGNLQVEIFDGPTSKGSAQVNGSGDWTKQVTGLTVAEHRFTAKGLYGSNPVSTPPRTLTVTRPLVVDTSTMILDGVAVYVNGWVESGNTIENNTKIRQPTSGTPEYTYQSSDPTIVQVTGDGSVTGRRNGTAIIKVLDASGRSAEYTVRVTNVYKIVLNSSLLTPDQATAWARSQGHINLAPLNDVTSKITAAFSRTYGMYPNPNQHFFPRTETSFYPTVSNPPAQLLYGWIAQTYVVNTQGGKVHDGLMSNSTVGGSPIVGAAWLSHIASQSAPPLIHYQGGTWFTTRSGAYALLTT
jgi:hypothetical protein